MKLLLICASNEGWDTGMMGLASLATFLENRSPFVEVRLADASLVDVSEEAKSFEPDLVGISSMTISQNRAEKLAAKLKRECGAPIILGGTHISCLPGNLSLDFTAGVRGEGEETLAELCCLFQEERKLEPDALKDIPGLVFHSGGKLKLTQSRSQIEPIDDIPMIKRSLLSDYYRPKVVHREKVIEAGLMTSRGCPFKCRFCASSAFWDKTRFHSPERVADEIEKLVKDFGVNLISVWDDTFSIKTGRVEEIISLLEKRKLIGKVKFGGHARATHFDDKTALLLKKMGFESLGFGFESGSEKILPYIKRGVKVEDNYRAVELAKKHGFFVNGYLIIANPTEKIADMRDTMRFMDYMYAKKVDLVMVFAAIPFPGTEYWDIAQERGVVSDDMDWDTLNQNDLFHPLLLDDDIDKEEYLKLAREFEAKQRMFGAFKNRSLPDIIKAVLRKPGLAARIGREIVRSKLKKEMIN